MSAVRVDLDLSGMDKKFSEANLFKGRYAVGNQMLSDMEKFVPRQTGDLRSASFLNSQATEIVYSMQYAEKQFTTQFKNYTAPGTGPRWDLKAKGIYMDEWVKTFVKGANF